MWRLDEFRFDEQIEADEAYVFDDSVGELMPMTRDEAIVLAHGRGQNLVASWPAGAEAEMPSCRISKVSLPLRWEKVSSEPTDEPTDERALVRGAVQRSRLPAGRLGATVSGLSEFHRRWNSWSSGT